MKNFLTLQPWEWQASNFSQHYNPYITHEGHENKGNDHQLNILLIDKQILFVSTLEIV